MRAKNPPLDYRILGCKCLHWDKSGPAEQKELYQYKVLYIDTTGVIFTSIVTSIPKFCNHLPDITKNLLKCRRFNLPGARDWSFLGLFSKMPKYVQNLMLGPRGWHLELGRQRVNLLDLKGGLWIYTGINASRIWPLLFSHWTETGGKWLQGCVGCKGESASSSTANPLF